MQRAFSFYGIVESTLFLLLLSSLRHCIIHVHVAAGILETGRYANVVSHTRAQDFSVAKAAKDRGRGRPEHKNTVKAFSVS